MVTIPTGLVLGLLLAFQAPSTPPTSAPASASAPAEINVPPIAPVIAKDRFPWYDSSRGRVVPLLSWPDFGGKWWTSVGSRVFKPIQSFGGWLSRILGPVARWFRFLNRWRIPFIGGLGDLIAIGLAMLLLTVVLVALLELLRRYRPLNRDDRGRGSAFRPGVPGRIEGLPAVSDIDLSDPWAEAGRLRARGDYARAVVYLFAHQLLTLERLQILRLVPGRTGRQLVRTVADRQYRGWVEPTLRLFEAVYYGHHVPSTEAFESVWALALAFESRAAGPAPGGSR